MREGWRKLKIKDICTKGSSNIAQNKIEGLSGDYAVYGASGYVQNVDFYHQEKPYIGIVKDGSGVGRVNVYPAYSSLLGTLQYIIPKEGYLLNYVAYALKSKNLSSFAAGAAIPHIYFKDYGECEVLVPSQETQQQIVAELDLLSHILDQKRQQLKEYDALAESIFYDMFGDPVENPKGWEKCTISEIVNKDKNSIKRGPFGGALKKEIFVESGYLVYEQYHALNNDYSYERYYISEDKFQEMKDFSVKEGDIIISCSGVNLGRLSIIPKNCKPGIINQALLKLSLDSSIYSSLFFTYVFSSASFREKYLGENRGCAIPNLPPMSEFKRILFVNPPLSLQQSFASKIEAIEKQKQMLKESIKDTETLFQSRMDYWFNA